MEKEVVLKADNMEVYQIVKAQFERSLEESNKLWYGTIRLLITLSSTILLASIGFVDKVIPILEASPIVRVLLVISWVLFFISIAFCILAELMGSSHHAKRAVNFSNQMKQILFDLGEGKKIKETRVKESDPFIEYPSLFWGLTGVMTFLFGMINISLCLVDRYFPIRFSIIVMLNGLVLGGLIFLIRNHYKQRGIKKLG